MKKISLRQEMPPSSLPFFVAHVLATKNSTSASPSLASGTKSPVTAFWPAGDPFQAAHQVFLHARVAILRICFILEIYKRNNITSKHLMSLTEKVAQNACTNVMFVCINVKCHMYKLASISLHWNIWQFEQPKPGAASTVAVKVAGLAAKWWNLQTETSHLPPSMPPNKWPIRNKAPTKTPSTNNTPSGVNPTVQTWGSSKKTCSVVNVLEKIGTLIFLLSARC